MNLVEFSIRWIVGIVFIYASLYKIIDPCNFAYAVENYKILPFQFLINSTAVYLPFLELICGTALLLNTRTRGASFLIAMMTLIFIIAISINTILGRSFDCGCFSAYVPDYVKNPQDYLFRDIFILVGAVFVYIFRRENKQS
jgi:putative oxidoreductase